jgi:hypothetical protein
MSSQDTVTTGSGIVINLDRSRGCRSPDATAAAAAAVQHAVQHADKVNSTGDATAAGRAAAAGLGFGMQDNSNSWQLAAGGNSIPSTTISTTAAAAGSCKDTTLLLADLHQLLTHQLGAAAAQQQLLPQQHMIQVNYALQDPATAYVLERSPMPATSSFEHVHEPAATSFKSARQLQDLLPSVNAGQAATAAAANAATAKDLERGSSTSSSERAAGGRGGRLGRPLLLLRQLKAAGRRIRGKQGSVSQAAGGTSEHLLGFTGGGMILQLREQTHLVDVCHSWWMFGSVCNVPSVCAP